MKSVCASGSWPHFSTPAPRPVPKPPPSANEYTPCSAWKQAPSGSGLVTPMQPRRSARCGTVITSAVQTTTATPTVATNSRSGAPTIQSSANSIATRIIEVPMSPPSMISASSSRAPGTSGTSRCFQVVRVPAFCLRASRSAPQSTSASLANSEGWNWKKPKSSQFWLPLIRTPMPGTATSASAPITPNITG